MDSAIHWINRYPLDNSIGFASVYPLDSDLSGGQRYPSFEQLGPDRKNIEETMWPMVSCLLQILNVGFGAIFRHFLSI